MLSAVHRGTAFEQRSLRLLQQYFSMALRRVGGKSDGGIDLLGWWWLPFATDTNQPGALSDTDGLLRRRLRIIGQCKAEKKKFSPKYVREMEGVWHLQSRSQPSMSTSTPSSPVSPNVYPTVALLLSESSFSQSTVLHAYRSVVPFLLVHLPCSASSSEFSITDSDTNVNSVFPNPVLTRLVEPLAFRWERKLSTDLPPETDVSTSRPGLWWQGRKLRSWAPDIPDCDTISAS